MSSDDRIWLDESHTTLNQTKLMDLIEGIDEIIIDLLMQNESLREKFFVKIKDVYVFKNNDFKFFMEENKVDNSYTQYANRIGLTAGGKFIKDSDDVVLDFPFKDCVLEGGQSTEEGLDNYYEWKDTTYKDALDENGEKIKEKNRLVKVLDEEAHYELKTAKRKEVFFNQVLAHDEIDRLFDPKALVNWKRFTAEGVKQVHEIKRDSDGIIRENLIIKGNNLLSLHSIAHEFAGMVRLIYIDPPYNTENDSFKYNDSFSRSTWLAFMKNRLEIAKTLLKTNGFILVQIDHHQAQYLKILMDEVFGEENFRNEIIWSYRTGGVPKKGMLPKKHDNLFLYANAKGASFQSLKERQYLEKSFMGSSVDEEGRYYVDTNLRDVLEGIIQIVNEDNTISTYNTRPVLNLSSENIENFRSQKPEGLIHLLMEMLTKENDIVLDFFAGTGTTHRVAMKTNRQIITVEQMDETIENLLIPAIIETINGSEAGISNSVNWKGGGDFIYFELAKWNEQAKELINKAKNLEELISLFDELYQTYFLNYNVRIKDFKEKIVKEDNFIALSLEEKKRMFLKMLDLNQMYVNASDMEDKKFGISEQDQALTNAFYGNKA